VAEVATEFGVAKSTAREGVRQRPAAGAAVRAIGAGVVRPADLDVGRILADVVTTHLEVMADLERLADEADRTSAESPLRHSVSPRDLRRYLWSG
jgi:hypothetical protein